MFIPPRNSGFSGESFGFFFHSCHSPQLHDAPRLAPWASSPIYLVSIHFCPSGFPGSARCKHPEMCNKNKENWVPKNKKCWEYSYGTYGTSPKTEKGQEMHLGTCHEWLQSPALWTFPERTRQFPTSEQKQVWIYTCFWRIWKMGELWFFSPYPYFPTWCLWEKCGTCTNQWSQIAYFFSGGDIFTWQTLQCVTRQGSDWCLSDVTLWQPLSNY